MARNNCDSYDAKAVEANVNGPCCLKCMIYGYEKALELLEKSLNYGAIGGIESFKIIMELRTQIILQSYYDYNDYFSACEEYLHFDNVINTVGENDRYLVEDVLIYRYNELIDCNSENYVNKIQRLIHKYSTERFNRLVKDFLAQIYKDIPRPFLENVFSHHFKQVPEEIKGVRLNHEQVNLLFKDHSPLFKQLNDNIKPKVALASIDNATTSFNKLVDDPLTRIQQEMGISVTSISKPKSSRRLFERSESAVQEDFDSFTPATPRSRSRTREPAEESTKSNEKSSARLSFYDNDGQDNEAEAAPSNPPTKKRKFFTEDEIHKIMDGYRRYGNQWAIIRDEYKLQRSTVDIKDKVRNLKKKGIIAD